jgi:hypothetical protein
MTEIKTRITEISRDLAPGSIWGYFDGGNYRILSIELNATSYEETHEVGIVVVYEQLYQGYFPKGQIWVRSIDDFRGETQHDGRMVPKFSKVSDQS